MRKLKQPKQPTWTALTLAALESRPDNFMTAAQLRAATGATRNQQSAALIHLRKRHAVDCVVEPDGVAWWFATTAYDDRTKHVDERCPEEPGNRHRRKGYHIRLTKQGG